MGAYGSAFEAALDKNSMVTTDDGRMFEKGTTAGCVECPLASEGCKASLRIVLTGYQRHQFVRFDPIEGRSKKVHAFKPGTARILVKPLNLEFGCLEKQQELNDKHIK